MPLPRRPYLNVIPQDELALFNRIADIIAGLPDLPQLPSFDGDEPSLVDCHHIAHAFGNIFPELTVEDGCFGGKIHPSQHSWLRTKAGFVIDPYPAGAIEPPALRDARKPNRSGMRDARKYGPWYPLYRKERVQAVYAARFPEELAVVEKAIREFMRNMAPLAQSAA